jgi:hypothetical protein
MKTKDVLLVVGGVALGYFASKMNWGKNTATAVGNVATGVTDVATGVVTDVKDVAVDTVKLATCEKKLMEATSTMRFASAEAGDLFKKQFLADCVASK